MSRPDGPQLIEELRQRHLVAQISDEPGLAELLSSQVVPVYAGYDPTASSLHVGNLVPTILLKRFQLAGHRPIVLVGGATGMVGDPSGKSDERNLLDDATLAENVAGIRAQLSRLLDFDGAETGAVMTNNADWTRGISYLEFLRDYGKHLTINYMMAKDSVKSRLEGESGISYTEFSYMLLQAMDFVHLAKAHAVRLQVGGSDQYGNITAGCELSRKMGGVQLYGLTAPLLLDSTGQKMGKSASGERIWLDPERTTPYAFYQYWFNRPDDEVPRLLKLFSLRPLAELDAVLAEHDADRAKPDRPARARARAHELGPRRRRDRDRRGGEPGDVRRLARRHHRGRPAPARRHDPDRRAPARRARGRTRDPRAARPHGRRLQGGRAPAGHPGRRVPQQRQDHRRRPPGHAREPRRPRRCWSSAAARRTTGSCASADPASAMHLHRRVMDRLRNRRFGWVGVVVALAALGFLLRERTMERPDAIVSLTAILIAVGGALLAAWTHRSHPPRSKLERW